MNGISIEAAAKSLGWGRNRLFALLRDRHVLIAHNNLPYQSVLDRGYFTVRTIQTRRGHRIVPYTQTLVTPEGLTFIAGLIGSDEAQQLA